jgi:hypothetical protein
MNFRPILCAASLALMVPALQTSSAQPYMAAGELRCEVSGGLGLIIASSKEMSCVFTAVDGHQEHYFGRIGKFGLDVGVTDTGVLGWAVLAPTNALGPWALAGDYAGVGASATIGVGLGANALVGGSNQTISLQPLSLQAQTGLDLAGGVAALSLRPGS